MVRGSGTDPAPAVCSAAGSAALLRCGVIGCRQLQTAHSSTAADATCAAAAPPTHAGYYVSTTPVAQLNRLFGNPMNATKRTQLINGCKDAAAKAKSVRELVRRPRGPHTQPPRRTTPTCCCPKHHLAGL